jgi:hypothetical protein
MLILNQQEQQVEQLKKPNGFCGLYNRNDDRHDKVAG